MNELDTFTINFITNGLDKLQDGIKDLRNQMDSLENSFTQGTTKGDGFFDKFGGWLTGLTALAAGFISVSKAINSVFSVSGKVIDLNLSADRVGRTALEVETLSRALMQFSKATDVSEMFGEAEGLYKSLNTITGKAWRLQYGKELADELSRADGIVFKGDESDQEMISKIIQGLEYHTKRKDWHSRDQLASVLGLSSTAVAFLGSGEAKIDAILKKEREKAYLYSEENLKNADLLQTARRDLADTWNKISLELSPLITKMINQFNDLIVKLTPLIKALIGALTWVEEKFGWLIEKAGQLGTWAGDKVDKYIISPVNRTKNASNAISSLSRLQSAFSPNENFLDTFTYTDNYQLLNDIDAVEDALGKAISDNPETRQLLELASERAREIATARTGIDVTRNASQNNTVNVENINITGMGEDAANKTKDALGKKLGDIQPAYNVMGDL